MLFAGVRPGPAPVIRPVGDRDAAARTASRRQPDAAAGNLRGQVVLIAGGGTGLGCGMAVEFARLGATVAVGVFPHDDVDARWGEGHEERMRERSATIPAGRVGRVRELGWAATYLCSPYAAYVSGHHFVIDGANWHRRHGFSMPPYVPIPDLMRGSGRRDGTALLKLEG